MLVSSAGPCSWFLGLCVFCDFFYYDLIFFETQAIGHLIGLVWKYSFPEGIVFVAANHQWPLLIQNRFKLFAKAFQITPVWGI